MALLPGRKDIVSAIEVQAVEKLEAAIQGRAGDHGICGQRGLRS